MLVENGNLKAEVRRLRIENADLVKRVRFADTNAHYMRVSRASGSISLHMDYRPIRVN